MKIHYALAGFLILIIASCSVHKTAEQRVIDEQWDGYALGDPDAVKHKSQGDWMLSAQGKDLNVSCSPNNGTIKTFKIPQGQFILAQAEQNQIKLVKPHAGKVYSKHLGNDLSKSFTGRQTETKIKSTEAHKDNGNLFLLLSSLTGLGAGLSRDRAFRRAPAFAIAPGIRKPSSR